MLGAMLLLFGKQESISALKWWGTAYLLGASSVAIWTIGGTALGEPMVLAAPSLNPAMRLIVGAAIVAIYAGLTASELWSERRRTMHKRWPTIVVPVMHGGVLALPILLGSLLRPHDETFTSSIWVTAFSIELVLYAIGTVFVIFMLVSDRAVTVHKTAASVDPLSGMLNRRGFTEASNLLIEREAAAGRPVTVMIFD